jgi:hypothetical protein
MAKKEVLRLGAFNSQVFWTTKALKPEVIHVLARIIRTYGYWKLSYSAESHISLLSRRLMVALILTLIAETQKRSWGRSRLCDLSVLLPLWGS